MIKRGTQIRDEDMARKEDMKEETLLGKGEDEH